MAAMSRYAMACNWRWDESLVIFQIMCRGPWPPAYGTFKCKCNNMKKRYMLLIITTTITGLMAGLFYAWSISVTPGIGRLGDKEYLASFQAMNRAIVNPVFLICFLGAAVLLPVCTFMEYAQPISNRFWFLLGA